MVDWLVEVAIMKVNVSYCFFHLNFTSVIFFLHPKLILLCLFQDFPSQIVHIAVNCVDQYLMRRKVQRSELQLLGITCMLIAARLVIGNAFFEQNIYKIQPLCKIYHLHRFQGKDIVTIREAAWLTDGTYKYEEVVRYVQLNDVLP